MARTRIAVSLSTVLAAAMVVAACGGDAAPTAVDSTVLRAVSPVPGEPSPTAVVRREPTATPTPEPDPLAPVDSVVVPGIPVPYAAQLVVSDSGQGPAGEGKSGTDSLAEYLVADTDAAGLRAWFLDQMPAAGWDEGEERDDTLVFRHLEQRSARADADEPMRTATIFFEIREGVSFSILAEAPASAAPPPSATTTASDAVPSATPTG